MARILLINDEPDLLEMCQIILESVGHSVRLATDPSRAVDLAKEWRPEAVLLDLIMPATEGDDVFEKLRGLNETANVPIVIMSALPGAKERTEKMGAEGFVAKPFDPAALVGAIDEALGIPAASRPVFGPRAREQP